MDLIWASQIPPFVRRMESSGKESTTDISVLYVWGPTLCGGLWGPYLCHGNDDVMI